MSMEFDMTGTNKVPADWTETNQFKDMMEEKREFVPNYTVKTKFRDSNLHPFMHKQKPKRNFKSADHRESQILDSELEDEDNESDLEGFNESQLMMNTSGFKTYLDKKLKEE